MGRHVAAPIRLLPWLGLGLAVLLAAVLAWTSLQRNWQRACDVREWPNFTSCPASDGTVPEQVTVLRSRIATNPGESFSWLALALLTTQPGGVAPLNDDAVLAMTTRVAGPHSLLLRAKVSRAMQREQWPEAVALLVQLVQNHGDAVAAQELAALIPRPQVQAALRTELKPGTTWLEPVLGRLADAKVPVVLAMPLVAQALPLNLVTPRMGQALIRELKAAGYWLDAHGLWRALVGRPVPFIFNGDFEHGFISDGFDWELRDTAPSRAGALVAQPELGSRGHALQVEFTGRPVALPVVRQILVLMDGSYTFTGRYMASRLRTDKGLAWTFTCVANGRELVRTPALVDTKGEWLPISLDLTVPPDCGAAVALQLQTQAAYEAQAGLRGQMAFDDFRLTVK